MPGIARSRWLYAALTFEDVPLGQDECAAAMAVDPGWTESLGRRGKEAGWTRSLNQHTHVTPLCTAIFTARLVVMVVFDPFVDVVVVVSGAWHTQSQVAVRRLSQANQIGGELFGVSDSTLCQAHALRMQTLCLVLPSLDLLIVCGALFVQRRYVCRLDLHLKGGREQSERSARGSKANLGNPQAMCNYGGGVRDSALRPRPISTRMHLG